MAVTVHRYHPRGAAKAVLESRAPEVLLSGPAGTGKSRACLQKMHLAALKYPRMRGLIARKTQTSLGSTALVTWREQVAVEALANGTVHWYGGSQQEAAQYRYRNGSTITVGGMDKATKIMSSEYDMAYGRKRSSSASTTGRPSPPACAMVACRISSSSPTRTPTPRHTG